MHDTLADSARTGETVTLKMHDGGVATGTLAVHRTVPGLYVLRDVTAPHRRGLMVHPMDVAEVIFE